MIFPRCTFYPNRHTTTTITTTTTTITTTTSTTTTNGVARNFYCRGRGEKRSAEGIDRTGMERLFPPQVTRGSGERIELPSGVRGRAQAKNSFGAFSA